MEDTTQKQEDFVDDIPEDLSLPHKHWIERHTHQKVRLLTYNIFMRPVIGFFADQKDERMKEIKQAITKYDIACFQEIFPHMNGRREELMKFANRAKFKYAAVPPSPGFTGIFKGTLLNSGLLTLSKYPIKATKFFPFKAGSGVDALAEKGVLYCKIELSDMQAMHLFNTHTQATYNNEYQPDNKSDHNNYVARLKQLMELRTAIDLALREFSTYSPVNPDKFHDLVIVAGDFNVNSRGKPLPKKQFTKLPWVSRLQKDYFMEYEFLVGVLSRDGADKIIDLACEGLGEHPITFGDVTICPKEKIPLPRETCITSKSEWMSCQSLDYIFQLVPGAVNVHTPDYNYHIDPKDCKQEEFFFANSKKFTQLSDHYGIECSLTVRHSKDEETHPHPRLTRGLSDLILGEPTMSQMERTGGARIVRIKTELSQSVEDFVDTAEMVSTDIKVNTVTSEEVVGKVEGGERQKEEKEGEGVGKNEGKLEEKDGTGAGQLGEGN